MRQRTSSTGLELYTYSLLCFGLFRKKYICSINRLEAQLTKARNCYASLQKSRLELEAQIQVKTNSIYIDEVKCKSIRQGVNIQAY